MSGGPTAEKEPAQKIIMFLATLGFAGILVVSALDFRFKWSDVSPYAVIVGDVLTVLGFYITFLVYKENSFASATIEIMPDQKVISTGPYAIVRHPNVHRRDALSPWHAPCARFMVGLCSSGGNAACLILADIE